MQMGYRFAWFFTVVTLVIGVAALAAQMWVWVVVMSCFAIGSGGVLVRDYRLGKRLHR